MIGPFRASRTKAAAGIPSQPNVFYVGVVNGGVWKTTDYGRTWNPIFDDQPTGSIGAIAVAPSNPNVVYVGSGEGLQRPDLSVGDGIYKSSDAGATWTHLGLRDGQQIPQIVGRPARSRSPVRRGARPPVRSERRARTLQVDRRREDISENPLQGREHGRGRRRSRSGEPGHRLRGVVGGAAGAVGERRLFRSRQRPVQIDRRGRHVEATWHWAADVRAGWTRPHRHHGGAESAEPDVRDGRSAPRRRFVSVGRRGRELAPRRRPTIAWRPARRTPPR